MLKCSGIATPVVLGLAALLITPSAQAQGILTLNESFSLVPPGLNASDSLGLGVSIDAGRAAVGAPDVGGLPFFGDDGLGTVFLADVAKGVITRTIDDPAAQVGGWFGLAVALEGSRLVVGSPGFGDPLTGPAVLPGVAYLFDADSGALVHTLNHSTPIPVQAYADTVGLSGDVIAVGARRDNEAGPGAGAVFVFDAVSGLETFKLVADDAEDGQAFGTSVDVDDGLIAIGAPGSTQTMNSEGAAYLFDAATGSQVFKLEIVDASPELFFGRSIAIENGLVVVGAAGSAYLFDAASGQLVREIEVPVGENAGRFAEVVAIGGDSIIIGAPSAVTATISGGAAYVYNLDGNFQRKLIPTSTAEDEQFGVGVAIDGFDAVVGADLSDQAGAGSGAVFLFNLATGCSVADVGIPFGFIDLSDVDAFIEAFLAGDALADIAVPLGFIDLSDVDAFIAAFLAGCP